MLIPERCRGEYLTECKEYFSYNMDDSSCTSYWHQAPMRTIVLAYLLPMEKVYRFKG